MIANYFSTQRGSTSRMCGKMEKKRGKLDIRIPNSLCFRYAEENFLREENADLSFHVKGNLQTPVPQTVK